MNIYNTYLDLPRGAEWMIRGAEKHHPLGFKQHPSEDAGKHSEHFATLANEN